MNRPDIDRQLDSAIRAIPMSAWWTLGAGLLAVLVGVWTTAGTVYTMKATLDQVKADLDEYKKESVDCRKDRESLHIDIATLKAKCQPAETSSQPQLHYNIPTMTTRRP